MPSHRSHRRRRAAAAPAAPPGLVLLLAFALALAAAPAGAQGVLLELRPRPGDTLQLRLDQEVAMVATQRVRGADSTVAMGRKLTVFSRSIATRADARGATIVAVTDSMLVADDGGRPTRVAAPSQRASLHVAPDGTTRVLDDGGVLSAEATAMVSQMPATLPKHPVEPGASWSHTAEVPLPGQPAGAPTGKLTATFRLDSLSRYGDVAFVSMRGTLEQPREGVKRGGLHYASTGSVVGAFQVDRRRGWLTGVRATITTRTAVTKPGSDAEPMTVRTKVTQWLRAVDKD